MSDYIKKHEDSEGCGISVVDVDGNYIVDFKIPNYPDVIRSIKNWKCRDDDIILWAYPKSGTHWLWDMLYQLYTKNVETVDFHKSKYMLEALTEEQFDALPSPRIMNTHIKMDLLPTDFFRRRCKLLYIVRNPKDTAVSFYNHHRNFPMLYGEYKGKWENYLPMFLQGRVDSNSWFDHVKGCEHFKDTNPDYPLFITFYENLKDNCFTELQSLANFLSMDTDEKEIEKVIRKNEFQQVKKDKMNSVIDKVFLRMYRKGEVGDWKNWFTVAQNEMFDAEFERQMKHAKISVRFCLSK